MNCGPSAASSFAAAGVLAGAQAVGDWVSVSRMWELKVTRSTMASSLSRRAWTRDPAAGRPVTFDAQDYMIHNVVECAFSRLKNWRDLASRNDSTHSLAEEASSSRPSCCGCHDLQTRLRVERPGRS